MHLEILSLNHSPIALLSILCIVVGGFFLTSVHRLFFHPLAKIPGPFWARVSRFWHTYHYASGNWHDVSHDLHKKYGPIVRIAPDEISFVDAVASKRLYSYARAAPKTKWYHTWTIPGKQPSFFAVTNNKEHARRRRQVATAYSMTSVLAAENLMQDVTDVCWEQFHRMAALPNERLDLGFWATGYAYDIVGELAFGKSLKIMETGKDQEGIIGIVHGAFKIMASSGHLPGQTFWFFNPVIQLLLSYLGEDSLTKLTNNVTGHVL